MAIEQLGRFKVTGILGKGAMGSVYRAYDPVIDREVAIKTVACAGLSQQETEAFEQRFYREARSAGRLNHPNIVTIHDVGRDDGLAYIAMELLTGQTLREVIDSGVVLPPDRCAEIAAEIADGLAFAHAKEVVHRDIKPANIMVLDSGAIRIADFGVAQIPSSSTTVDGKAFGSPKYMSPEQVLGEKVDGRSDIFSLGVVLYEMLTGRPPFDGEELTAVLYQVLNGAPPLPSTFHPGLPRAFDRLVAKAMAKDPAKRYQNAADMAQDLRKCRHLFRQLPESSKAAAAKPLPPAGGRGKVFAGGTMAAVLVVGLVAGIYEWSAKPRENQEANPLEEKIAAPAMTQMPEVAEKAADGQKTDVVSTPEQSSPSTTADAMPKEGTLRLAVSPWGEVYVDGKTVGIAPPLTVLRLPPGKHRVEIRNSEFPARQQQIDIVAGQTVRIKHKFQ